ncbi:type II toxin-antitoxin system RelE/ParE family toxin [Eubacteriales bacterium OttesenSCG-928-A19]|nr:type II toxin-antitoxin system RelE/ParE family toxin [Eubacteriales bacterium OttesenSCG-928-A19]
MAKYQVEFDGRARKTLKKLDRSTANIILSWIKKNLVGTDDPRRSGKALTGELKGLWRYRVGDYRLICHIEDEKVLILILKIGNRRDIYE